MGLVIKNILINKNDEYKNIFLYSSFLLLILITLFAKPTTNQNNSVLIGKPFGYIEIFSSSYTHLNNGDFLIETIRIDLLCLFIDMVLYYLLVVLITNTFQFFSRNNKKRKRV